jgi:hypothetical protein
MASFNVALLGKQGWRFITSPDSLCARVLQARYYHNKPFMEAMAPRTVSHTWRAIITGREALSKGIIKRVGTEDSISIWNDNWIPSSGMLWPLFRTTDATVEKVSELITEDTPRNRLSPRFINKATTTKPIHSDGGIPTKHIKDR